MSTTQSVVSIAVAARDRSFCCFISALKPFAIDGKPVLSSDQAGEIFRKPIGIVQLEGGRRRG